MSQDVGKTQVLDYTGSAVLIDFQKILPIIKTMGTSGIPWFLGVAFAVDETSSLFCGSSSILSPIGGSGVPFLSSNGTGDSK